MSDLALASLEPQQKAVVTALDLEFAVRERLAALGVRIGRKLHISGTPLRLHQHVRIRPGRPW